MKLQVADVAIDSRSGGSDAVYTYLSHGNVRVGQAFLVSLGPRSEPGFVISVREVSKEELGFDSKLLKPLGMRIEGLDIPENTLETVRFIAKEYLCPIPVALGVAIPPGAKERLARGWSLASEPSDIKNLSSSEQEAIRVIQDQGGTLLETKTKPLEAGAKKVLRKLAQAGIVLESLTVARGSERHRIQGLLKLISDSEQVEKFLKEEGRKKPAQALTLMRLQGSESTSFTPQEIKALSGVTDATIRSLIQAGMLEKVDADDHQSRQPPVPNSYQSAAIDTIRKAIVDGRWENFLLYGVTGSGKTEVYLRAAEEALRRGKQVLYLVPEIALTAQVIAQLRERFGRSVAVLHSNLSPQERFDNWMRVSSGEAPVVLGARSALFAPIRNLGLIILDEEHEASYKQESSPRYHAKRAAQFLASTFSAPLVLGSATPSVESFWEAEQGDLNLLRLPERAASAKLPTVFIEDLSQLYKDKIPSLFLPILKSKIVDTLKQKHQVILFLNRRAFAPFLMCRDCGHRFVCSQCAVSLAYHKRSSLLRCHHCGYQEQAPDVCPDCGGLKVSPFGAGVEKVEQTVRDEFENVNVGRLDRDVARIKGALENTLASFRSGEMQVLVGTQMVAKGLDFPNVTLVGVIAADISLNIPDFRASERTFQLLSQVAGRAGRGDTPGEVVIQTFSADNVAVLHAKDHDYEAFYQAIITERHSACYPPFVRLVNCVFSSEDRKLAFDTASFAHDLLVKEIQEAIILGPVDCPLERLQNQWRFHLILKVPNEADLTQIGATLSNVKKKGVNMLIDVDPYSLM